MRRALLVAICVCLLPRATKAQGLLPPPLRMDALTTTSRLPAPARLPMTWIASATGGIGPLQYEFRVFQESAGAATVVRPYSASNVLRWVPLVKDRYYVEVRVRSAGSTVGYQGSAVSPVFEVGDPIGPPRRAAGDIDADRISDLVVWRPANGTWFGLSSRTGYDYAHMQFNQWGSQAAGDVPLMGDFDGDGIGDPAVWRASTGMWFWLTSSSGFNPAAAQIRQWGSAELGDVPMIGDMDGDRRADLVVWRSRIGAWYWLTSATGYSPALAGARSWPALAGPGYTPMLADLDGDGIDDLTYWRAADGFWFWLTSSSGYDLTSSGFKQWGNKDLRDKPMTGDFDGDGRDDLAIWRASTGTWYWLTSSTDYAHASAAQRQWGNEALGDIPAIADFDGDGRADLTVWRAASGTWHWLTSATGYSYEAAGLRQWGSQAQGDVPIMK